MPASRERKFRRFDLKSPIVVHFPSKGVRAKVEAVTKNISLGGVLLESNELIPEHSPVVFTITIQEGRIRRPIKFVSAGKVVRVERTAKRNQFAIGIACNQPITQLVGSSAPKSADLLRFPDLARAISDQAPQSDAPDLQNPAEEPTSAKSRRYRKNPTQNS
jgi:PilZ domain